MEYSLNELVWFFLFYSLAGWCAGVAVAALRKHTFVNTGFLNLPLCPIYGVAAVLFTVFLSELRDHLFFPLPGRRGDFGGTRILYRVPVGAYFPPEVVGLLPPPLPV